VSTALLMIDSQVYLFEGMPIYDGEGVRGRIRELIGRARAVGVAVIFVRNQGKVGEVNGPDTPGWQIHPDLAPAAGEVIVDKATPDAFYQTTLGGVLADRGIGRLVLAGLRTELSIDTTCRRAVSLGYEVVVAADAHSTLDRTIPAAQIIAHHNDVLQRFATVMAAADITFEAAPALSLGEPLEAADRAAIQGGLEEAAVYERWLAQGEGTPFWRQSHPTRVTDHLRQLWDGKFTPQSKLAPPAGWELGMARSFAQPLAVMPGFWKRTAVQGVAQAIDHLLQSPTNPFAPQMRKLAAGLWSYDAKEFRLFYSPRTVMDKDGRERKFVFLIWLAPALPSKNPFA
jgi:nicotinamidase-related amidase